MPIIATATQSKTFTPAPEGTHQAVCVDVIDLGMKETTWQGKLKVQHKIDLVWQIAEARDDGKPYQVYKRYTLSLNEKASLRHDLESWRGKPFTIDEEHGFDVETVIGANCLVNIQHRTVADKTYANVVSVMPLIKGMAKIGPLDYKRPELKATAEPADDDAPVTEDVTFDPREYDDNR
jgi:hypothetical protein